MEVRLLKALVQRLKETREAQRARETMTIIAAAEAEIAKQEEQEDKGIPNDDA